MVRDYFSANRKERLFQLYAKRVKILRQEEQTWILKSRPVWLEAGDNNTNFFHRFSNQRKITNYFWELKIENGDLISDKTNIKDVALGFFSDLYRKEENTNLEQQ